MAIVSDVEIRLRADIARLRQDMERARQEVNRPLAQMSRAVEQFKGLLAGIGAGLGLSALVGQLVGAQREFDKLNAALIAVTGSTKGAKEVFAAIQDFAARTPYSVAQVTDAFLKLRNLGLMPSERALSSYGNTASAMGKDLNQLIEAVADAASGEFERLKEFGVKSKKQGDDVAFTFQGTTTVVKNSANEIEKYLMQIGEVNFAGAMALQANTLNGDLSALADTWNQTLIAFNQSGFGDSARGGAKALSGALTDLQAIMKAVAGEAAREGEEVAALGPIHQGLTTFFEAITVLGVNVAYTFSTIGKSIGVFAGQAAILFSGGFAGLMDGSTLKLIREVGAARTKEAEEDRRQVDATSASILGAAAKAAEVRRADAESRKKNTSDVLGEYKILDAASQDYLISLKNLQDTRARGAISEAEYITKVADLAKSTYSAQIKREGALTEAQEKAAKKSADARTKAANDQLNAYKSLIDAAQQQVMVTGREAEGLAALTKSQEMAVSLDKGLADGKIVLTARQEAYYRALIETIGANEDTIRANEKAKASAENVRKAVEELDESRRQTIESARTEADSAERLVTTFGMTAQAIEMVTISRMEDRLARAVDLELDEKEIAYLTELIELKRRSATATGQLDELKKTRDMWESIDKTAHDTFVSIMDGGKSAATRLKDTFKNIFFDWLYQQTLKKWIINLQGSASMDTTGGTLSSLAGMFGGGSTGGGGGSGIMGSASSLLSIGKTIYSGFSGGIATSLGTMITQLGTTFGSTAVASFGAGMSGAAGTGLAGGAAGAGASAASAIPIIGWIIAGMNAANGFFKQGFDIHNGSVKDPLGLGSGIRLVDNIFRGIGLNDKMANIFSGQAVFAKLFGRANPRIEKQGIEGTVSAGGFSGQAFADILEKGGWFRSDKRYTKTSALDGATDSAFDKTITTMVMAVRGFGEAMGLQTDVINGYSKQIKLTLGKDEAENQKLIDAAFSGIADDLSNLLIPNLARFAAEGEAASTTLQRLATEFQAVNAVFDMLGVQAATAFGAVGIASLDARKRLLELAGGVDALASQTSFFAQNFLSAAEQIEPAQKALAEQMAALGYAGVDTADEFKAAVLNLATSGALATEAGAKQYAALLALAPVFKQVTDYTEQLTAAEKDLAESRAAAAADLLRQAASTAFDTLQRSITAKRGDLQTAFDKVMDDLEKRIGVTGAKVDSLTGLSELLAGTRTGQFGMDRMTGQAQIQAALAIAKASGVLPSADSLRDAISAVSQDAQDQFSSLVDYQRDALLTQNAIEELAGITDTELSIAKRVLAALEAEKLDAQAKFDIEMAKYDEMLSVAQQQLDAINGTRTDVLSVIDAFAQFAASITAALGNSTIGAQPSVTGATQVQALYGSLLGRTADAGGLKYWSDLLSAGYTVADIERGIKQSQEYLYNNGMVYTPQQSATMSGSAERQQEINVNMQAALNRTAAAVEQLAGQFDQVTGGGTALLTETV